MSMREHDVSFWNKPYEALSIKIKEDVVAVFDKIYESLESCDYGYLYAFLASVVCKCSPDSFRTTYDKDDMAKVLSEVQYALGNRIKECYRDENPGPQYRESGYFEYDKTRNAFIGECYKKQEEFDEILDFSSEESQMQTLTNATNVFLQHCSDEIDSSDFDICYETVLGLAKGFASRIERTASDPNNIVEVRYPSDYKSFMEGKREYVTAAQKQKEARLAEERKQRMLEQQEKEKEWKRKFSYVKILVLMPLVMAVLYFVAIANLPYGYYTFLRVFSLIFLGIFILTYCTTCSDLQISMLNFPNVAAGAIIVLFNPIFPIYMDKSTWIVFDAISAIIMIAISIFIFMQYSRGSEK